MTTLANHLRSPRDMPADAWRNGILWPVLHEDQRRVYWQWRDSEERIFAADIARRWGKSAMMLVSAHEDALRRPGAATRVPYGAQTGKEVREVIRPMCEGWLWDAAPKNQRPRWVEGDIVFPSGSRIAVAGVDREPDRLRGPALDSAYCDEVGFWDNLEYVLESILLQMAQGRTWARFLLGSTPPITPAHKWTTRYVPECRARQAYAHRTIEDNPRLSREEVAWFVERAGGRTSTTCRRELYAEHVLDESLAIIPEFAAAEAEIVREHPRPRHFDAYTALDPGFTHHAGCVFAYWDFEEELLVFEHDFSLPRQNSRKLAELIREREHELWSEHQRYDRESDCFEPQPYMRVSDTDARLIADLQDEHGLRFYPTAKDHRDAQVNAMRLRVYNRQIRIHPRCVNLIAHMKFGVWNKPRTQFAEVGDFGHFDTLAAAIYLDRNVERGRNPFPPKSRDYDRYRMHVPAHLTQPEADGWEALAAVYRRR